MPKIKYWEAIWETDVKAMEGADLQQNGRLCAREPREPKIHTPLILVKCPWSEDMRGRGYGDSKI